MPDSPLTAKFSANRRRAVASILILLAVFVAQYVLFKNHVLGEVAPYYPANHDQAAFLREAYYIFENVKERGGAEILKEFLAPRAAQGKLLTTQASALFLILEPSRLSALLPNLLYFIALQASVFYLIRGASGRLSLAFVSLGLLLMIAFPFYGVGDLFDFRIDFQAFCLYGIFVTAMATSGAFLSGRWVIIATVLGFLLALLRHVTLGYIGGVYILMLAFIAAVYFTSRDADKRREAARRARNVVLSGIAVLGSVSPFLWASRKTIYEYYGVGHFLGKEKDIRSPGETMGTNVVFYLKRLHEHVGAYAAWALLLLLAAGVVLTLYYALKKRDRATSMDGRGRFFSMENFVLLAIAAAAPFLILIVDMNKSPVVGSVMITPVVLFCILAFSLGAVRPGSKAAIVALCSVAVVVVALGLKSQYSRYAKGLTPEKRASLGEITRMSLEVGDYCVKNSIAAPAVSFDTMRDYMTDGSLMIINYEARQKLLRFNVRLANSIFDISEEEAIKKLMESDIVLFSPDATVGSGYPFDKSIDAVRPALIALLEKEFLRLKEYRIYDRTYWFFVKPRQSP
jgi:hypothetical protein